MSVRFLAGLMAVSIALGAAPASAQVDPSSADSLVADPTVAADPIVTETTVPVFGTSLIITITSDADGAFVDAVVTPASADPTAEEVALADSFVATGHADDGGFEVKLTADTADGMVKIEIETDGSVEVEGPIGAIAGTSVWAGDPLNNGHPATVTYTVSFDADGNPVLDLVVVTDWDGTAGLVGAVGDAVIRDKGDEFEMRQSVTFYMGDGSPEYVDLTFTIEIEHGKAELKVELIDPNGSHDDDDDHESDHHDDDDDDDDDHDDDHGDDHDDDHGDDHDDD